MKKLLSLIIAMMLALSFAGCGEKEETQPAEYETLEEIIAGVEKDCFATSENLNKSLQKLYKSVGRKYNGNKAAVDKISKWYKLIDEESTALYGRILENFELYCERVDLIQDTSEDGAIKAAFEDYYNAIVNEGALQKYRDAVYDGIFYEFRDKYYTESVFNEDGSSNAESVDKKDTEFVEEWYNEKKKFLENWEVAESELFDAWETAKDSRVNIDVSDDDDDTPPEIKIDDDDKIDPIVNVTRAYEAELEFFSEGGLSSAKVLLHDAQGYSIYIPWDEDDPFDYDYKKDGNIIEETWISKNEVFSFVFRVNTYRNTKKPDAKKLFIEANEKYTFEEYADGSIGGKAGNEYDYSSRYYMPIEIYYDGSNTYIVATEFPEDAWDGFGAMAGGAMSTFSLKYDLIEKIEFGLDKDEELEHTTQEQKEACQAVADYIRERTATRENAPAHIEFTGVSEGTAHYLVELNHILDPNYGGGGYSGMYLVAKEAYEITVFHEGQDVLDKSDINKLEGLGFDVENGEFRTDITFE